MKKTISIIIAAIFCLTTLSLTSFAETDETKITKKRIELSETQQEQMHKIKTDFAKKFIKLESDVKILKLEKRELMMADTLNSDDIKAKLKAISVLRQEMSELKVDELVETKAVLTAEQWDIYKYKAHRMGNKKGKSHGNKGKGRMGKGNHHKDNFQGQGKHGMMYGQGQNQEMFDN